MFCFCWLRLTRSVSANAVILNVIIIYFKENFMSNQLYTKDEVDAIVAGLGAQFAHATTANDPLGATGVASVDARNENRPPRLL